MSSSAGDRDRQHDEPAGQHAHRDLHRRDEKTVTVDADPSGTFTVSDLPPGDYLVEWKYETSGPPPSDGVDIGTALSGGRIHVNLSSGDNTVRIPLS